MNASHTPGPWTYDNDWSLIMGPNGEEIAAIHAAQSQYEARCNSNTASSNAKLIASAPTLLIQRDALREALEAVLEFAHRITACKEDGGQIAVDKARTALLNSKD